MSDKKGDLGNIVEQAWSSALIKTNSTNFKKTGEIGDVENVRSFSQYLKEPGSFATKIDMERRMDDKLKKYLVMTVVDKNHRSDDGNVDLLTDNKGHDIAMIYIKDENLVVEVSPEVLKNNKAFLGQAAISNDGSKIEIGNLEELSKIMEPDSIEKIIEQIEKYDSVKMRSRDDARNRVKDLPEKDKEKADVGGDLDKGKDTKAEEEKKAEEKSEEELEQEAEEAGISGETDLDVIVKICKENGLSPADIKQTLTVVDPATIENDENNRTNVNSNGGMVLMLRFKNKEAGTGPDDIYMVQDGKMLPSDKIDNEKMTEIMTQNEGNPQVHALDDDRVEDVLEELIQIELEYQEQLELINSTNAENKEEMMETIEVKYKGKVRECIRNHNPEIDGHEEIENIAKERIENKKEKVEEEEEEEEKEEEEEIKAFEVPGQRKRGF